MMNPACLRMSRCLLAVGWATRSTKCRDWTPKQKERIVCRARRRRARLGAHRVAHRDRKDQPHRALRLSQGHPQSHRRRPSARPNRRSPALELQTVKLSSRCCPANAYVYIDVLESVWLRGPHWTLFRNVEGAQSLFSTSMPSQLSRRHRYTTFGALSKSLIEEVKRAGHHFGLANQ